MRPLFRRFKMVPMEELICIRCEHAVFLDPKKEVCYKTGGLFCKKLKAIVGKYDACRLGSAKKSSNKKKYFLLTSVP